MAKVIQRTGLESVRALLHSVERLAQVMDCQTAADEAVHFSCSQVDALALVFALAGDRNRARAWIQAHVDSKEEEEGDGHHRVITEKYLQLLLGETYEGTMFDHPTRPCDDPQPCNCCKDCGRDITWMGDHGPWGDSDWAHSEES